MDEHEVNKRVTRELVIYINTVLCTYKESINFFKQRDQYSD